MIKQYGFNIHGDGVPIVRVNTVSVSQHKNCGKET